jgi:glycosyltransferase involved in cell wall biosynthesis
MTEFLRSRPGRKAAIFHDAIPLRFPQITWPKSVARHPSYLKLLAAFDRVWAVSAASRDELLGFWRWQGIEQPPPVEVLALGSDFDGTARVQGKFVGGGPSPRSTTVREHELTWGVDTPAIFSTSSLLCVGILEPRKNQLLLLDVCEELWADGVGFDLHLVGRVNPHFGRPIVARIGEMRKRHRGLHYHEAISDAQMGTLYATVRATLFPTQAEGCGLPLLESLWRGVPCVCSDLPVLRENSAGGGCLAVAANDRGAWKEALNRILKDDRLHRLLTAEARSRALPTWADAGAAIKKALRG